MISFLSPSPALVTPKLTLDPKPNSTPPSARRTSGGWALALCLAVTSAPAAEIWRLDRLDKFGGHPVTVIGGAHLFEEKGEKAVRFDGFDDALLVHANPVKGLSAFTIEVLINPAPDGLAEQRFMHIQQNNNPIVRVMIETRLTPEGKWCLDTALFSPTESGVLIDRTKLHPTNTWAWVALRYDGKTMANFVNGTLELERAFAFPPMDAGQTTLAVRHNLVSWYKGAIREVRIHRSAIPPHQLAQVRNPR